MVGHDHEAVNEELVAQAGAFQDLEKLVTSFWVAQVGLPSVAGKGDEVRQAGLVEAVESAGHGSRLLSGCGVNRDEGHSSGYGENPTLSAKNADKGGAPNFTRGSTE